MQLTRRQALNKHRKMWNWIADETEKRGEIVEKRDYFAMLHKENPFLSVLHNCYCCEYNATHTLKNSDEPCDCCPINWGINHGIYQCNSYMEKLRAADCGRDVKMAVYYVHQIANLSERKDNIPEDEWLEKLIS